MKIFHRIKFLFYHFHNENFNIFILNINFQIIYQSEQQNFNRTNGVFKDMKQSCNRYTRARFTKIKITINGGNNSLSP